MHLLFLVLALSVQQAPQNSAPAAANASEAPAASQSTERPEDRLVCRRERLLGSNRPQRICMTQRQWDNARDTSRDQLDRMRPGAEELPKM